MPYQKKKPEERIPDCPHLREVTCSPKTRNCDTCGWNPRVAKARLINICRAHGIEYPLKEKEEPQE